MTFARLSSRKFNLREKPVCENLSLLTNFISGYFTAPSKCEGRLLNVTSYLWHIDLSKPFYRSGILVSSSMTTLRPSEDLIHSLVIGWDLETTGITPRLSMEAGDWT